MPPTPAQKPVFIYNADCGLCDRWADRWHAITGDTIEYLPASQAAVRFPDFDQATLNSSVWLLRSDGDASHGAKAIFQALTEAGKKRHYLWAYEHLPIVRHASEGLFNWVSNHRPLADRIDRWWFADPNDRRRSYHLMRPMFLRGLGAIYLIAFVSLWVQIIGLVGADGILPIGRLLSAIRENNPEFSSFGLFMRIPTLCWFNASDGFLQLLCGGGSLLACLLILGLAPTPILVLLWLFYLSLLHAGQVFLGYQWDALLLEAGLLAIFFAPLSFTLRPGFFWRSSRPITRPPPSRAIHFLLRWLLFRLMFLSGLVKLIATVPAWREFTAMRYHYETQPLPPWTAWYAHLLPNWFQAVSVGGVFFAELLVPLLFFANRRLRLFACAATICFQLLILTTGNFGFFNLLSIVLCLVLVDDAVWMRIVPPWRKPVVTGCVAGLRPLLTVPLALVIFTISLVPAMGRVRAFDAIPGFLIKPYELVAPFASINAYGLFGDMTTRRYELIIEGSNDQKTWLAYEFKWKPGDVKRTPRFCIPHMPRLDWQMWFAALGIEAGSQPDPWLYNFLRRLAEGSPTVLKLMDKNPFPDHPPKYLRVSFYDYWFTTWDERAATGAWWKRVEIASQL
jgi:predicted DCC family thiol-disulfide oxidoreductase YuxK